MPTTRFRRATPEDAAALLSVKRAAIEDLEHWQYSPEQVEVWKPEDSYVDTFAQAIRDDRFVVHVAERGAGDDPAASDAWDSAADLDGDDHPTVVGYGALTVPDRRIDAIYVHPNHHGEGVATSLVKQLEASARVQGIAELDVVAARNAVGFYESLGYWRLDEEVTTIEDVEVEFVRTRKDLSEPDPDDLLETAPGDPDPSPEEWFGSDPTTEPGGDTETEE